MTQQEKSEITKSKILEAAKQEFSEKGLFGARIDEIAATAGVNKRMIYEHYQSKENLYKTVLNTVYAQLAEYEKNYYLENTSPELAIRKIVEGSFRFLEATPDFVRILMWENLNNAKYLEAGAVSEIKNPTIIYIKEQIRRGIENGDFSAETDEDQIIISLLNFEFSYFSNMHTLSSVLGKDLSESGEIKKRAVFISDLLIKYLKN